jgi:hypothetical protein
VKTESTSRSEFDRHRPARGPGHGLVYTEEEYFTVPDRSVFGVLVRDITVETDWGLMIYRRDDGVLVKTETEIGFRSPLEARNAIVRKLGGR